MADVLYLILFLAYWFIVPFLLGTWFFKKLMKNQKAPPGRKWYVRVISYIIFLLCALLGWFIEMLVLTGVKMLL